MKETLVVKNESHLVWNSVIATLFGAAMISLVITLIPNGWQSIFSFTGNIIDWLINFTSTSSWILVILGLCTFALIVRLLLMAYSASSKADELPDISTQQTLFGIVWRWRFTAQGKIHSLAPFCPDCGIQIYPGDASGFAPIHRTVYHCDDCQRDIQSFECRPTEVEDLVVRKIEQELRRAARQHDPNTA